MRRQWEWPDFDVDLIVVGVLCWMGAWVIGGGAVAGAYAVISGNKYGFWLPGAIMVAIGFTPVVIACFAFILALPWILLRYAARWLPHRVMESVEDMREHTDDEANLVLRPTAEARSLEMEREAGLIFDQYDRLLVPALLL